MPLLPPYISIKHVTGSCACPPCPRDLFAILTPKCVERFRPFFGQIDRIDQLRCGDLDKGYTTSSIRLLPPAGDNEGLLHNTAGQKATSGPRYALHPLLSSSEKERLMSVPSLARHNTAVCTDGNIGASFTPTTPLLPSSEMERLLSAPSLARAPVYHTYVATRVPSALLWSPTVALFREGTGDVGAVASARSCLPYIRT